VAAPLLGSPSTRSRPPLLVSFHVAVTYLKAFVKSCRGCESRSERWEPWLPMAPARESVESSFQEKWNNHPLAGFQAVSDSLFFNSTGALGSREGLGGKPGGSDRSHERKICFIFPLNAGVHHPGCARQEGGAGSASGILGLRTASAWEAEPVPRPSPVPSLEKVRWWWLLIFVTHMVSGSEQEKSSS